MVGRQVERCRSCHAELPAGASFCPACGEPTGVLAIDQLAQAEGLAAADAEVVLRPGWQRMAGVVAALALIAGAAWLVGRTGSGDDSAAPARVPTTTATTATPAERPTTTVASPWCESLRAATSAVLPAAAGVTLVLADTDGLVHLDLATGTISCGHPQVSSAMGGEWTSGDHPIRLVRIGSGTLVESNDTRYVPDDPSEAIGLLETSCFGPGPEPGTLWEAIWEDSDWEIARVVDVTRTPWQRRAEVALPRGAWPAGVDGGGRLLLESVGGYYTLSVDGSIERLWEGQGLIALNARTLVAVACDDRAECRWLAEDRVSGQRTDLGEVPELLGREGGNVRLASLSPDGTLLATPYAQEGWGPTSVGAIIVDLRTGAVLSSVAAVSVDDPWGWMYSGGSMAWSADSRFVFWVDPDGVVQVWQRDGPATPSPIGAGALPPIRGLTATG